MTNSQYDNIKYMLLDYMTVYKVPNILLKVHYYSLFTSKVPFESYYWLLLSNSLNCKLSNDTINCCIIQGKFNIDDAL